MLYYNTYMSLNILWKQRIFRKRQNTVGKHLDVKKIIEFMQLCSYEKITVIKSNSYTHIQIQTDV